MFRKIFRWLSTGLLAAFCIAAVNAGDVAGYYWMDDGNLTPFSSGSFDIPVNSVSDGMHMLNLFVCSADGVCSPPLSKSFVKIPATLEANSLGGLVIIDGGAPVSVDLSPLGANTYTVDIDMSRLAVGVHNLQFLTVSAGGAVSGIKESWFFRSPTDTELDIAGLVYFIDGKEAGQVSCSRNEAVYKLDIDTESLATGIHSIDMALVLPNGEATGTMSAWFYKTPVPPGVVRYEYWFNDDYESIRSVTLDNVVPDFQLISMLDVPELPFDSKNYAFSIVNGKPTVSNVQHLSMRFFESDGRPAYGQAEFIDSRSARLVTDIQVLANGSNDISSLENSEIKWFSFEGEVGDSIVLRADRAVMLELYSPDGDAIVEKRGSQAEEFFTVTLTKTGTYYLAVHDIMASNKKNLSIGFHHIPRNAILEVKPSVMTSSGTFTLVELFGNGMSNAKSLIIDNGREARYETKEIAAIDNYHLNATINLEEPIPAGVYDVTLVVDDPVTNAEQRVTKAGAVTVLEAGALSNIEVEVIPSKKPGTPYMVEIQVTNNSDVPCWGIPLNIACERDGGKNGFVFYMSDFLGETMTANHIRWYESANIIGTGTDGLFFPVSLTYMQPHETRTLQVGIISEPHKRVGLYAWAGTPYNEEAGQILAMPRDSLIAQPVSYTNMFNIRTAAYILQALEEIRESFAQQVRAHAPDDNRVLEALRDYGPDAVGRYRPLERPAGYADQAVSLAEGYGRTYAGIANSGAGYHCYNYFKNEEHIPGATLGEQVANIEKMYDCPDGIPPGSLQIYYQQAKQTLGRGSSPEDIAMDTFGPDWLQAARSFLCRNGDSPNPMPTRHDIDVLMSGDPNMITGYSDPTGGNAVGLDVKELDYTIEFENDPAIATASANSVVVSNKLDKNVFDLESFTPKNLQIGSHAIKLPAEKKFVRTIDMRPKIQCIAEVRLDFSAETGDAVWTFTSLDPLTMEPVENYRQGLLPVNDESGVGVGFINYSVELREGLSHSTSFSNSASIVFDTNEPVVTPTWTNVTDYVRPEARIVKEYGYDGMTYGFDVEASDEGSGILSYDLYARIGDDGTWTVVLGGQTDNHIEFAAPEPIDDVQFMVRATDRAGNRQLSNGILSSVEIFNREVGEADDERWYNLQGVPQNPDDCHSSPAVMISTKGRKVVIR